MNGYIDTNKLQLVQVSSCYKNICYLITSFSSTNVAHPQEYILSLYYTAPKLAKIAFSCYTVF